MKEYVLKDGDKIIAQFSEDEIGALREAISACVSFTSVKGAVISDNYSLFVNTKDDTMDNMRDIAKKCILKYLDYGTDRGFRIIDAIKAYREETNAGLRDSKDMIESVADGMSDISPTRKDRARQDSSFVVR